jgi:hypothetical protein
MLSAVRASRATVIVTVGTLLWPSLDPLALAGQSTAPKAATLKPPAATAAKPATAQPATPAKTLAWPRDYATASGGALRIFQPQVASWDNQQHVVMYAAVSYSASGADKPALGTVKIEADTSVAIPERQVNFKSIKLSQVNFPGLANESLKEVVDRIAELVPAVDMVMSLDHVLAQVDKSMIIPKNVAGVKADPPVVFHSTTPAILVNIDGEPVWSPIKDNDLRFAVNTNWDLFEHAPSKRLYLRNNHGWLTATSFRGPWKPASGPLPDAFNKLPADDNWKDVKAALPGLPIAADAAPKVFVSTVPAELILLTGPPSYLSVTGTGLLWVSNTESDVFRLGNQGPIFFLVSGRWFSAPAFDGPWTFATTTLPDDFKKIPLSHQRSRVLASVPGTSEAAEAVLLAQVPETARVEKKLVQAPAVDYQGGDPMFQPIEQTSVSRAVNADKDIIKVGELYYMCYQGVWFQGKSPTGPWEVTGSVPSAIYEIPASNPAFPVTQVTVVENSDDAVTYATAAAYTGMMVAWGCAVWGTGYYYPPYVWYGGYYPYYRPYYPTYGYHASYNPWTGAYSRGITAYGPYGGAGIGARYNPRTGTYSRGAAAWGPYGARGVGQAYNPRTGTYGATRQGSSVYGSWGRTGVTRGNDWATTSRVTNNLTGNTTRVTRGSDGGAAVTRRGPQGSGGAVRTEGGDVYAGRDGNVYKRGEGGGWESYDPGGGWKPSNGNEQLQRDSAARAEGAQRARDAGSSRSGSGSSYRPSGGGTRSMPRGGGGRRR